MDSGSGERAPAGIDVSRAHAARMYDFYLGGKDHFAADRATAAKAMASVDNPRLSSGPEVVARTIVRAATARRPKPRYASGKGASTVMTARRALPDRAFDAIMTRLYLE